MKTNIADNFLGLINTLSDNEKMEIIDRISDTLKNKTSKSDDSWKDLLVL